MNHRLTMTALLALTLSNIALACPQQTLQGVYQKTVCKSTTTEVSGSTKTSPEICHPVIKFPDSSPMKVCEKTVTKAFNKEVIVTTECHSEPLLNDPNNLMKGLSTGVYVTVTLNCLDIEDVTPRGK